MRGAVIGDVIGSVYEMEPIKRKDFELFGAGCGYTDDSVCTAAAADILLSGGGAAETMQQWCRRHLNIKGGYGLQFAQWIQANPPAPYNSWGNGSAMRVSPAAFINRGDLDAALAAADKITEITHNHPDGMKGARATAHAVWLAFNGESAGNIRAAVAKEYGYNMSRSVDEIRPGYEYDVSCRGSVPESVICALESESYEDAVRNAVSLGGDADTMAAIAGAVAEAMHGIPEDIQQTGMKKAAPDIVEMMDKMYRAAA